MKTKSKILIILFLFSSYVLEHDEYKIEENGWADDKRNITKQDIINGVYPTLLR